MRGRSAYQLATRPSSAQPFAMRIEGSKAFWAVGVVFTISANPTAAVDRRPAEWWSQVVSEGRRMQQGYTGSGTHPTQCLCPAPAPQMAPAPVPQVAPSPVNQVAPSPVPVGAAPVPQVAPSPSPI